MASSSKSSKERSDDHPSEQISVHYSSTGTVHKNVGESQFYFKFGITSIVDTMDGSGRSLSMDMDSPVKMKHLRRLHDGSTKFPKLEECAHFHYENVELGHIQVNLREESPDIGQGRASRSSISSAGPSSIASGSESDSVEADPYFDLAVCVGEKNWSVRRTYSNFCTFDRQLHRCIFDRKYSMLPELHRMQTGHDSSTIRNSVAVYLKRFSSIAGNNINCGPVLCWLELDNRGNRLLVTDDSAINIPAVAAAHAVRRYAAQAPDEISLEVGNMISLIDMPPLEESTWWRGKRGFEVGFFPAECVEVLRDKLPPSVESQISKVPKPVLHRRGKLISFLRSFFSTRPARSQLKRTGIVKERVFGCDLGEHLLNSGHDVPLVLSCCTEVIEEQGIVDGIYRLSGVASTIQKLRNEFDEDRIPELRSEEYLQDIHSVSSLLKAYFRELPNPLLTYQLYDKFAAAMNLNESRLACINDIIQQLPPPHYRTTEYLFRHLHRISQMGHKTGMHAKNLAIVWAPNLMRSKDLELVVDTALLQGVGVQAIVTEFLINNALLLFSEKALTEGGTARKMRPKSLAISTPTKLLSLEEAREQMLAGSSPKQQYIEVGGGPQNLPKEYHTVIELPSKNKKTRKDGGQGAGWRSIFSRSKPGVTKKEETCAGASHQFVQLAAETEVPEDSVRRRKLRTVRSAETLAAVTENEFSDVKNVEIKPLRTPVFVPKTSSWRSLSQEQMRFSETELTKDSTKAALQHMEVDTFGKAEELYPNPAKKLKAKPPRKGSKSRSLDPTDVASLPIPLQIDASTTFFKSPSTSSSPSVSPRKKTKGPAPAPPQASPPTGANTKTSKQASVDRLQPKQGQDAKRTVFYVDPPLIGEYGSGHDIKTQKSLSPIEEGNQGEADRSRLQEQILGRPSSIREHSKGSVPSLIEDDVFEEFTKVLPLARQDSSPRFQHDLRASVYGNTVCPEVENMLKGDSLDSLDSIPGYSGNLRSATNSEFGSSASFKTFGKNSANQDGCSAVDGVQGARGRMQFTDTISVSDATSQNINATFPRSAVRMFQRQSYTETNIDQVMLHEQHIEISAKGDPSKVQQWLRTHTEGNFLSPLPGDVTFASPGQIVDECAAGSANEHKSDPKEPGDWQSCGGSHGNSIKHTVDLVVTTPAVDQVHINTATSARIIPPPKQFAVSSSNSGLMASPGHERQSNEEFVNTDNPDMSPTDFITVDSPIMESGSRITLPDFLHSAKNLSLSPSQVTVNNVEYTSELQVDVTMDTRTPESNAGMLYSPAFSPAFSPEIENWKGSSDSQVVMSDAQTPSSTELEWHHSEAYQNESIETQFVMEDMQVNAYRTEEDLESMSLVNTQKEKSTITHNISIDVPDDSHIFMETLKACPHQASEGSKLDEPGHPTVKRKKSVKELLSRFESASLSPPLDASSPSPPPVATKPKYGQKNITDVKYAVISHSPPLPIAKTESPQHPMSVSCPDAFKLPDSIKTVDISDVNMDNIDSSPASTRCLPKQGLEKLALSGQISTPLPNVNKQMEQPGLNIFKDPLNQFSTSKATGGPLLAPKPSIAGKLEKPVIIKEKTSTQAEVLANTSNTNTDPEKISEKQESLIEKLKRFESFSKPDLNDGNASKRSGTLDRHHVPSHAKAQDYQRSQSVSTAGTQSHKTLIEPDNDVLKPSQLFNHKPKTQKVEEPIVESPKSKDVSEDKASFSDRKKLFEAVSKTNKSQPTSQDTTKKTEMYNQQQQKTDMTTNENSGNVSQKNIKLHSRQTETLDTTTNAKFIVSPSKKKNGSTDSAILAKQQSSPINKALITGEQSVSNNVSVIPATSQQKENRKPSPVTFKTYEKDIGITHSERASSVKDLWKKFEEKK